MTSGIRECFVPRSGFVFAVADYSGLELCTMAQVCKSMLGYSKLLDDLNNGFDPHCRVASRLLKISYGEAIERKKDPSDKVLYNARQTGKVANFGMPGGLGPDKLILYAHATYHVTLTRDEAVELKGIWLDSYPEFRDYFRMIDQLPEPLSQLFSGRLRGGCSYTAAANTMFQGLGGDVTKCAGFALSKACYVDGKHLLGSYIVNYEHDAYILEVPEQKGHDCAFEMVDIMVTAPKMFCPDVTLRAEPLLSRCWSKEAKPVWVDGRLVPWEPS